MLSGLVLIGLGATPRLAAQSINVLHNFSGAADGSNPGGVLSNGGNLIGTTMAGGINASGTLYAFSPTGGGLTLLHSFTNTPDGAQPNEVLFSSNYLYGTTRSGGSNNWGTVFKVSTNGTAYKLLHVFTNTPDGVEPLAGLATDGTFLFGATTLGGTSAGAGMLFRMDTNGGGYTVLHTFTNTPDGANPYATLTLNGTMLYGTTFNGGVYGRGSVFAINTNGTGYAVIYSFSNSPDAGFPEGKLLVVSNVIYGTSSSGGSSVYWGTIFKLSTNGNNYSILHSFIGPTVPATNSDGGVPKAGLLFNGGLLYGVTSSGGGGNDGTIFQISTNGNGFTTLYNFTPTSNNTNSDGAIPQVGLVLNGNALSGTCDYGGSATNGTLFNLIFSPTITAQPQNVTVQNGGTATFSVTAVDTSALRYQWYFNTNTLLAGQTNSTLSFASATNNNAGAYTVAVADNFGAVTSSPAVLTVTAGATPPTISAQPQPLTVTNGFTASFSVTANGQSLFYQWYFNTNTLLTGQTGSTLAFTANSGSAGYYSVIITNTGGAVTSSAALLTVVPAIMKPMITVQPQSQSVTNGLTASFSVTATGSTPLNYQWYFNSNTGNPNLLGSGLAGQTGSALSFTANSNNAGYYSVIVTNAGGAATSSPALLTVIPVYVSSIPQILTQPQGLNVTNGDTANFSVVATNGNLAYQWYFNTNNLLANQTNSSLAIAGTATANAGTYSVVVTNNVGSVTSSLATLTVYSNTLPIITQEPQNVTITNGGTAYLSATVVGLPPLRYQWYFNTNGGSSGTLLAGQTNNFRSFTAATNASGNYYFVVITNTLGKATSSPPALLTVTSGSSIAISLQPISQTITNGNPVSFTAAAIGSGTLSYQWFFQTNVLIAGATSPTLAFATANQPGAYSLRVTNGASSVTSSPAQLTVIGRPIMVSANFDAASGSYTFSFVNLAGSTNRLWASTNLASATFWRAIATNVMATNALWFVTDTNSAKTNKARFYRFSTP